jgi:hypothetical protein
LPDLRYALGAQENGETPMPYELAPSPLPPPRPKLWIQVTIALALCLALIAIFAGSLLYVVERAFRSPDAYAMALSRAQTSSCLTAKLGSPIIAKGMISGNISENGSGGSADFEIPVRGPRGKGELDVSATRTNGSWTITSLNLIADGGQIHLLPVPSPCQ